MTKFLITILLYTYTMTGALASEGFISVEKINGRWYFVDGEGKPFIQKGIVHTDLAENHWQSQHGDDWKTVVEDDMTRLGFDSHGYHSSQFQSMNLPFYVCPQLLKLSVYASHVYIDIFDPAEQAKLRTRIEEITTKFRDDPNLIGYMFTDVPVIDPAYQQVKWVSEIKALGDNTPGKTRYNEWKSNNAGAEDDDFISVIAEEYYRFASETFRELDPNHLLIGDNYGEWMGTQLRAIEAAAKYVDVISVQPNWMPGMQLQNFWDPIYAAANKPMIISDYKIPHDIPEGDDYYIDNDRDQEASGQELVKFFDQFMNTEYMIGWNHCTYVDEHIGGLVKQGIYTRGGEPYSVYQDYLFEVHAAMDEFVQANTDGHIPISTKKNLRAREFLSDNMKAFLVNGKAVKRQGKGVTKVNRHQIIYHHHH